MENRIGSKLLACLLVFVMMLTGAPFGAFATELDSDTAAETELIAEDGNDVSETGSVGNAEAQSVPQSENEDSEDISVLSAPSTDVPATAESVTETAEEPSTQETADGNGSSSDVNSEVTNEPAVFQSSGDMADPDDPAAADMADTNENENSDDTNAADAGDDTKSTSETTDSLSEENGDAEADGGATGTITDDVDTEENTESDKTDEVVDETVDDNTEAEHSFTAEIRIVVNEGQPVYMGETVSLKAEVTDTNDEYSIRWETHDPASDTEGEEPVWNTVGRGMEYAFLATQATLSLEYRMVVYAEHGEITSKVIHITALERPEETSTESESETDINTDLSDDSTDGEEPSFDDAKNETVNDQEDISTDGDVSIDSVYEEKSSDIIGSADEYDMDGNDIDYIVTDKTDAYNSPACADDDIAEANENTDGTDNTITTGIAEEIEDTNANVTTGDEEKVEEINVDEEANDIESTENEDEVSNNDGNTEKDENQDNEVTYGNENEEDEISAESEDGEAVNEEDGNGVEENDIKEVVLYSKPITIIQTYWPGTSGASNDALLTGYVEKLFGTIGSQRKLRSAYSVGSSLDGNNAIVYNGLKNMAAAVACGDETSTIYQYDFGELGPWTAADIGLQTMVQYDTAGNADITQEAVDAAFAKAIEQLGIDVDEVMNALLADCPYELYWFNKTKTGGYRYGYSSPGLPYYCENDEWYISCPIGVIFRLSVATAYQADENQYAVNATKAQEAHAAVANILDILDGASGMTTRQKLTYFKNQICDLVSYNDDAAGNNGTPYGDPWQLVWVFDGDSSTNVVCEGYSKAFKYLCDQAGISCLLVTGLLGEEDDEGPHMWNVVILDGRSYFVDVTNSDIGMHGQNGGLFLVTADPNSDWNDFRVADLRYRYDADTMITYSQEVLTVLDTGTSWEVPQPEFNGHSILLTGQIGLQFFLELPEGKTPSDYPGSYVTFAGNKVNSETQHALPSSPAVINGQEVGTYLFTVNLSSIQMADKITPTFHYLENGEDKTVVGDAYSVKDYIDWALNLGSSYLNNQQSAIIPKLADYGHYAQIYLSRQNGWTTGTNYAEMTTYRTSSYDYASVMNAASDYAFTRTQNTNDVANVNYRLTFGSQITLTVRIEPAAGHESLSISAGNAAVTQSGVYSMITYPGVYANQLADTHTIQAGDCAITVSPMSYVYEMLRNETVQNDAKDLMCALYGYAQACR